MKIVKLCNGLDIILIWYTNDYNIILPWKRLISDNSNFPLLSKSPTLRTCSCCAIERVWQKSESFDALLLLLLVGENRKQRRLLGSKDAGFVYESFRNETNRVIWKFFFHKTNPQNESFKNESTKRIHETNLLNTVVRNESTKRIFRTL
jgi:hypothetical protein